MYIRKQQGFTLIELLIVMVIAAIMTLIALPNMNQWIAARRVATQAEQFANLLRFSRGEAVRLNLPVYICPVQAKKDGTLNSRCDARYMGQGVIAFADKDRDFSYGGDSKDISLRTIVLNDTSSAAKIKYRFNHIAFGSSSATANRAFWTFNPNGTFGYSNAQSLGSQNKFSYADGYIQIVLTDADVQDNAPLEEKNRRSAIVVVDSSGRVEVCPKDDTRSVCQYK